MVCMWPVVREKKLKARSRLTFAFPSLHAEHSNSENNRCTNPKRDSRVHHKAAVNAQESRLLSGPQSRYLMASDSFIMPL